MRSASIMNLRSALQLPGVPDATTTSRWRRRSLSLPFARAMTAYSLRGLAMPRGFENILFASQPGDLRTGSPVISLLRLSGCPRRTFSAPWRRPPRHKRPDGPSATRGRVRFPDAIRAAGTPRARPNPWGSYC